MVIWWQLSEQQAALVCSAGAADRLPDRYSVSELACALPLDQARLAAAFADTAASQAALRGSFDFLPGRPPRQVIQSRVSGAPALIDLRATPVAGRSRALADIRRTLLADVADRGAVQLIRLAACQLAEEQFQLITVSHPALLDRWSLRAFYIELLRRCQGPLAGGAGQEPDGPATASTADLAGLARPQGVPPSDSVAEWARSFADYVPSRPDYWITEPAVAASADLDQGTAVTAPAARWIPVPGHLTDDLLALAARTGVSVADVVLAAHAKAVGAATGRPEVVVGVETECWDRATQRPLGMLTNVAVTRIVLAPGTWSDLVRRVAATVVARQPLRHLSYRRLQRMLGVDQVLDSSFCYSESAVEADLLDGTDGLLANLAGPAASGDGTPGCARLPFDGTVLVEAFRGPRTGRMALRLTPGPGLTSLQLGEVARLHVEILSRCTAASEPHQSYRPLTADQEHLVLSSWNKPARPAGTGGTQGAVWPCVHELFEQQVRRTPDAIAVKSGAGTVTYRDLNASANRLARWLRSVRIRPGAVVGVMTRRDAGLLISFLAVLKAGAAYLPLDPGQPAERIAYMLSDAGASLVISDSTYADAVPPGKWSVLSADDLVVAGAALPATDLGPLAGATDPMYLIYTSGSTGRPKGVAVPHRGVVNYLRWCADAYAGKNDGGTILFSSAAFDMVVPVIYTPLIMGQRVYMLDETLDMLDIADQLAGLGPFSFVKLTPSQLRILIDLLDPAELRGLAGTLVVGAEAFSVSALRRWRHADPDTAVVNEYGPTEASVGNCVHFAEGTEEGGLLPIGRPIPNTTMYVLDATLAPVPVGVPGELCIGGVGIAHGYAGRPDLTAERFIADPFSDLPGARLYRTGDIGRWLPYGVLTFIGRNDGQLKIRGYRVEPAEIEAVLVEHPAISAAVVSGARTFAGAPSLVAYYDAAAGPSPAEVRAYLVHRLPEYMIPNFLIPIAAIPLNANGKVDHKALPAPPRRQADTPGETAGSELDPVLVGIWADVFAVDHAAPEDPIAGTDASPFYEAQLAFRISAVIGISAGWAFKLVANARTMGELRDQLVSQRGPVA